MPEHQKEITDYIDPVIFDSGPINANQKRKILISHGFKVATKTKKKQANNANDDINAGDEENANSSTKGETTF